MDSNDDPESASNRQDPAGSGLSSPLLSRAFRDSPLSQASSEHAEQSRPSRSQIPGNYGSIPPPDVEPSQPNIPAVTYSQESVHATALSRDSSSHLARPDAPAANRPKKPPPVGRRVSKLHVPHRGQEFSVDDAPAEVEEDEAQKHTATQTSSGYAAPLRREPSTLRRRTTAQPSPALHRVETADEHVVDEGVPVVEDHHDEAQPGEEAAASVDVEHAVNGNAEDSSDAESFTLKDRQDAINVTHPFGIRIWKPALYKKSRSVQRNAEGDIHSAPGGRVSRWLWFFNFLWSVMFGWWLAAIATLSAIVCFVMGGCSRTATAYGKVFLGLAKYIIYPFGQFVRLDMDEAYAEEDEGEGRSISEYERWQTGDIEDGRLFFGPLSNRSIVGRRRSSIDSASENDSLLGRSDIGQGNPDRPKSKRRFFGRGQWSFGRVVFYVMFYGLVAPFILLVSGLCWLMVFWIPMGKVTMILIRHLRRHPLALSFHTDASYSRQRSTPTSTILVCTYRAVGTRYWKYTVDGTNIFLINLLSVVLFCIFDYFVLIETLSVTQWFTNPGFVFVMALFSVIPLAYFIGQAVASISAQSSMGVGAAINAFFSTLVEVFLYCVALKQGKAPLVEGSIIGSVFAGILALPGVSMCSGAIKRKTQRFNVKSAGVTTTMLLFAVIGAFGPTLFYQIYGSHQLTCHACTSTHEVDQRNCSRCYYSQTPNLNDKFYVEAVQPYSRFSAILLFLSYAIGLWFTLRTHAATIWNTDGEEKKIHVQEMLDARFDDNLDRGGSVVRRSSIRESQLYKRILGHSLSQIGLSNPNSSQISSTPIGRDPSARQDLSGLTDEHPYLVPPKSSGSDNVLIPDLSDDASRRLVRQVAEIAATAATAAARDATTVPKLAIPTAALERTRSKTSQAQAAKASRAEYHDDPLAAEAMAKGQMGGHDAPNWSRKKSYIVLFTATLGYAVIAEILVNTVDSVLQNFDIDEKFLGITLFALVPNTTEFLNAISFAMNGNIALSMEIGSAYALQVCLLQIPALVLFSAIYEQFVEPSELINHTFNLLFPQWDMVTVILCVFLLSYMYGEGKSNYFKGSILLLTYLVVIMGFYFSGLTDTKIVDGMAMSRFESGVLSGQESFWQPGS